MKNIIFKTTLLSIVFLSIALTGCGKKTDVKKGITIKGSDTMVHLMSTLAEAYMKKNPGSQVSVTGGGSGTGIAALINGTTDICASSRDMQEKEKNDAAKKNITPKEFSIANDGLAVFVNPANPVNELTLEQIKKIYTGAYTNWKELGGPDKPIVAYSRENSSGTYVFFQEHVLGKQDYAKTVRLMTATSAIIQSVTEDQWSIGYGGLGYTKDAKVKVINVKKDDNSPAVTPSIKTVLDKSYSIARPLFLYFNGEPQGEMKSFLDFCMSDEGQKIVEETGYVGLK